MESIWTNEPKKFNHAFEQYYIERQYTLKILLKITTYYKDRFIGEAGKGFRSTDSLLK